MPEITREMVESAYKHNVLDRGIAWVDKRTHWGQKLIGSLLELAKIQPKKNYEEDYLSMIPLPTGSVFATPFEPGIATPKFSLDAQLNVLAHEITHDLDAMQEGRTAYCVQYGLRKTGRVHREMRANASSGEWFRACGFGELDAKWHSDQMQFYGCTQEIPFADIELRSMLLTVNAGGVVEGLGGEAMIRWGLAKYPELIVLNPFTEPV